VLRELRDRLNREVPVRRRKWIVGLTWLWLPLLAVLAIFAPTIVVFLCLFPVGLLTFQPEAERESFDVILVGRIVYAVLTFVCFRARRAWLFYLLYGFLLLLLVVNAFGCQKLFQELDTGLH
jgi:hypothetical protein